MNAGGDVTEPNSTMPPLSDYEIALIEVQGSKLGAMVAYLRRNPAFRNCGEASVYQLVRDRYDEYQRSLCGPRELP